VPKEVRRDKRCRTLRSTLQRSALVTALVGAAGCAPTVDIEGVYVPAWLFSAVTGLIAAYAAVWLLAKRRAWREVARSGVLYCSLALSLAMITWWFLFSRF
jgi:uncharacterized membrane protein YfcA